MTLSPTDMVKRCLESSKRAVKDLALSALLFLALYLLALRIIELWLRNRLVTDDPMAGLCAAHGLRWTLTIPYD